MNALRTIGIALEIRMTPVKARYTSTVANWASGGGANDELSTQLREVERLHSRCGLLTHRDFCQHKCQAVGAGHASLDLSGYISANDGSDCGRHANDQFIGRWHSAECDPSSANQYCVTACGSTCLDGPVGDGEMRACGSRCICQSTAHSCEVRLAYQWHSVLRHRDG
jgi:hypothetical protein